MIPYLALNPAFLMIIGVAMLGEDPKVLGFLGCFIVLVGAYLVSIDARRKEKLKVAAQHLDHESEELKGNEPKTRMERLARLTKGLKGPIMMTAVAISWF